MTDKRATTGPPSSQTSPTRPSLVGLHHLKLPTRDVQTTYDFYVQVLGFTAPKAGSSHHQGCSGGGTTADGVLLARSPGGVVSPGRMAAAMVEFWPASAEVVAAQRGWDPFAWAVATRAELERWAAWLDVHAVNHSRVLRAARGWVLVAEDPDGRRLRLYTLEQYEGEEEPEWDEEWLGVRSS